MANDKKFIVKNGLLTPENAVIGSTTDNGVDQLQVTGTTNLSGETSISSNTASSATLDVHNFLGAGSSTIVATFRGDSDALQVKNIGTGDYSIVNTQQNNGIIFYDSTPGVVIQYNGSDRLNIDSTGNHFTGLSTTDIDGNRIITTADEGPGNGFDADTVDGLEASQFVRADVDDIMAGSYTIQQNLTIDGDLTVSGNTTYVDTETILLSDNILTLNANHSGAPTQDAGWEVNRGSSANSGVLWDETNDWFKLNSAGTDLGRIITTADEGANNGFDADTVDGLEGYQFLRSDVDDIAAGNITIEGNLTVGDNAGPAQITLAGTGADGVIYSNNGDAGFLDSNSSWSLKVDQNRDVYIGRDLRTDRHLVADENITATTGNISATAGSVSAGTTVAAGTTVTAGTDVIGQRFLDADNNNYYVNPADTSVMNNIGIDDDLFHNNDTDTKVNFTDDTIKLNTGGATRLTANNSGVYIGNIVATDITANTVTALSEMEAPRYYDRNNRDYYGDFHATSQMSGIDIDNFIRHRSDLNTYIGFPNADEAVIYTGGTEALFANNTILRTYRTLQVSKFQDADDPTYEVDPAGTSVMNTIGIDDYIFHNGDTNTYFGFNANDNIQFFTDGTQRLEINGTFITGAVDGFFPNLYAGRYYDSGNATYYVDPASSSRLNDISLVGEIIHDGDADTYLQFNAADSFRVVTGGSQRLLVNNTYVLANDQMRSPIFYDSNNTAYYGNFAGTSVMNDIGLDDYIAHNGDTDTYIGFPNNDEFVISTGGTIRFTANTSAITSTLSITAPTMYAGIYYDSDNNDYYFDGSSTTTSLTAAGKILIGNVSDADRTDDNTGDGGITIQPNAAGTNSNIQISGSNGGAALLNLNRIDIGNNPTNASNVYLQFNADGTAGGQFRGDASGNLYQVLKASTNWGFWTSGYTEALIVDDSANVMVNNSTGPTYTANDNTPLIGATTDNKLHVGGSVQLASLDDAFVVGNGTATFLKGDELGFGSGGGFYMDNTTTVKIRNNKDFSSNGDFYASTYYDVDNTNYYVDPAGDSQMNTIDIDDYIRHRGDTNTYFGFEANDTFRVWTNGVQRLNIDNDSADFQGNVYAPRYYDSNDNTFFIDGDGTSVLKYLNVYSGATTGELNVGRSSSERIRQYITDGIGYIQYWQDETDTTDHSLRFEILSTSTGTNTFQFNRPIQITGGGGGMYASIYYDQDDNRYYLDPNATGNAGSNAGFFGGNLSFGLPGNGTASNAEAQKGRWLSIEGNADTSGEGSSRIFFTEHNSSTGSMSAYGMSLGYRGGATSIVGSDGNTWTGLTQINNGEWGMWGHDGSATGQWAMKGPRSGSFVVASGSFRAPIFYDSNNTNYFVDPNSESRMDTIKLDGNAVVLREPTGDYGSFAVSGGARNGYSGFSIDDRFVFMHDGANRVGVYNDVDNEWIWYADRNSYMRLMYNGGEQARTDNGYFRANNQLRTPIFYDLNNTAFYVDPNNTSNIQNLIVNGTFEQGGYLQNNPVESYWYQQSTYSYSTSQTPNTQYYWIPVGVTNNGGAKGFLEYYAKDDVNYSGNVIGRIVISSWNSSSISIDHHTTGPLNNGTPKVRVDNNNRIWMQMDSITWDSYVRWHWVAVSGITLEDGSGKQLTTPANSIEILTGQQVRATLGNVTGATVTNTRHHFGSIDSRQDVRSPIYYDLDNTGYFGDFASRSRFNTLELGNQGALTGSTSYPLGVYHNNRYLIGFRNSGADANYPWLVHDNVNGKSAFIIHFNGKGDRFYVDEDGDTVFSGDITADEMFARRFVDTDDTNFYADPAGTSNFARLTLPQNPVGTAYASVATQPDYYIGQTMGNDDAWKIYGESPSGTNTGALILQSEDDYDGNESIRHRFKRTYGAYDTRDNLITYFNYVYSPTSFRAPIFYDSNDTNYYVNPASQSHMNTLTLAGNRIGFINSSFDAEIRVSDANPDGTGATFVFWGDQVEYNAEVATEVFRATRHMRAPIYYDLNDANYYLNPNGISILNDVRASIFYDRNDTNYYVNPASNSILHNLELRNYGLRLARNYTHNGIWFNAGTDTNHVLWNDYYGGPNARGAANSGFDGILWNTYRGIQIRGGSNGAYNLIRSTNSGSNTNDHYVQLYAANVEQLGTRAGYGYAPNQMRSPIYYDYNDTNYYANPAGTTRFYEQRLIYRLHIGDESNLYNGVLQETRRPDLTIKGQYPQLNLMSSEINNSNHGPTLRFTAYDSANASSGNLKHWVIGIPGTNATMLSFGYRANPPSNNPHYGIGRGWSSGDNVAIMWLQNDRHVYAENDVRADIFRDRNSTGYYVEPSNLSELYDVRQRGWYTRTFAHSGSDFANGTIVRTSIPATATNGASFVLEATGKSYSGDPPFSFIAQGYLYNNTIINYSGQHFGKAGFGTLYAFENGGVLCFWWPRVSYWNSFTVHVRNANGDDRNLVTSISNSTLPSYSKGVGITMKTTAVYNQNIGSGAMYATIYYDANDAGYYADPNGNSQFSRLYLNADLRMQGGAPIYFYTSSGSLRGYIRATETNDSHFEFATSGGEDFIFRDGGFGGSWNQIIRGNGQVLIASRLDTPIIYDRNNTGYYVDPNGSTQLRTVYANDWFRPQGNTGLYFQSYGHGLWAPESEGNSYGNVATYGSGRNGWRGYGLGSRWVLMSTGGDNIGIHDNSRTWMYYWNGSYHQYNYGYLQAQGSMRAPIFYDTNDTGYYFNGASDNSTRFRGVNNLTMAFMGLSGQTRSSKEYYAARPRITGDTNYWTGSVGWSRVNMNTVADWGSGFFDSWSNPPNQPSGTSHWVGVQAYHYTNGSARYGWQLAGGPISGLWFRNTWSGFSSWKKVAMHGVNEYSGSFYASIYYDSDNTGYYCDPNGTSRLNATDANEHYTYGWFRNRNSGNGLYNQATAMHFYSNNGYYKYAGGGYSYGGLVAYRNYESDLRGYAGYWDGNGFGLLNSSGNWQVRIFYGNSHMELYRVTYMNDARAYIFYDRNNTAYYADPNGNSRFNVTRTNTAYGGSDTNKGRLQGYGTWSSEFHKMAYISFDWNANYDYYYYHGLSSTDINGSFTDSMSLNSFNDINLRLDSNNNNGNSYVRIHDNGSGNSQNVAYIGREGGNAIAYFYNRVYGSVFYDHDSSYYANMNTWSRFWGLGTFYLRNNYDVSTNHEYGVAFANNQSTAYRVYREGGGWSYPYPDLRIAFHTGLKFGANPSYEGMRFYTDYNMASLVWQFNGGSNYSYQYRWNNLTGYHGIYSGINGAHFYPNNASYGSWRVQGSRNGWGGMQFDNNICLMMNYTEHGFYSTSFGWRLYLNGSVYTPGNVVAYWSDRRLKENIQELPRGEGLDTIMKLKPSRFNWKKEAEQVTAGVIEGGMEEVAVIAQETQDVIPNSVVINKAGNGGKDKIMVDGEELKDFLTVNYDKITPFLIQAVKDLKSELDELREEVKFLRGDK